MVNNHKEFVSSILACCKTMTDKKDYVQLRKYLNTISPIIRKYPTLKEAVRECKNKGLLLKP